MNTSNLSPVILALDTDSIDTAARWIQATQESISVYKVGLEFYLKFGSAGLSRLRDAGDFELFLDLKLHDIPHTVGAAVTCVAPLNPRFLTVHASGGSAMITSAVNAAPSIDITAVTVLTSLDADSLREMGFSHSPLELAVSLATNAVKSGARAIVCSPLEVSAIRESVGVSPVLITPGVRPADADVGDQSRVMTPVDAINAGATFLVIGRPITSYFSTSAQAMTDRAREIVDSLR